MPKCYIKNCQNHEDHHLKIGNSLMGICDYHYEDTSFILNEFEDTILQAKRDALKSIRHLGIESN